MFIDTHCHLNFEAFQSDYDATISRAINAGVGKMILPGSNLKTSKKAVEIAEKYPGVYAAVGLHPVHINPSTRLRVDGERSRTIKDEEFTSAFEKLANPPAGGKKVVAVGETGLDYYYDKTTAELQKELFLKHVKLAVLINKPMILHSRDAAEDILSILTAQSRLPKGVMHCFQENWETAQIILDMGFYISFTGVITFTKNAETFKVIENTPLERLLIETDSPYMTPEPYRGKRNEPAYVTEVAHKIAEIKKIPLEKVAEVTSQNAIDLFKLP